MSDKFLSARQTLLNLLDEAVDRQFEKPRHTVEDQFELQQNVRDLQSARERVLKLLEVEDLV